MTKIMEILDKITVIIPSFRRPKYLNVLLDYYSGSGINVICVDGSDHPLECEYNQYIRYFHLPKSYEERLKFAATQIKSPYAVICPDDEAFTLTGLRATIETMESDKKLAASVGHTVAFARGRNNVGELVDAWRWEYRSIASMNCESENFFERFENRHRCPGNSIFYAVARVEVLRDAIEFITSKQYKNPYAAEVLMELAILANGPLRVIPCVLWFRNRSNGVVQGTDSARRILLHHWAVDSDSLSEIRSFFDRADLFLREKGLPPGTSEYVMNNFMIHEIKADIFSTHRCSVTDTYIKENVHFFKNLAEYANERYLLKSSLTDRLRSFEVNIENNDFEIAERLLSVDIN
jgi:glycosyltransferase domain-containing protein